MAQGKEPKHTAWGVYELKGTPLFRSFVKLPSGKVTAIGQFESFEIAVRVRDIVIQRMNLVTANRNNSLPLKDDDKEFECQKLAEKFLVKQGGL